MDLVPLIKDQIDSLPDELKSMSKFQFVLSHTQRAELFLSEASRVSDDQYYNDAVYRSNQAFEAVLKEAYSFFTGKDAAKKNSFEIEEYILKKNILNLRVTDLLKNYRTQWRNPATHDYSLLFSQQEALVAVVSVQMFIKVLLDQVIVENAFRSEKERQRKTQENREKYEKLRSLPLIEYVAHLCVQVGSSKNLDLKSMSSAAFEGFLEAYISGYDEKITIKSQSRSAEYSATQDTRPDFLVMRNDELVALEFKVGYKKEYESDVTRRLAQFMINFKPKYGIAFFLEKEASKYQMVTNKYTNGIDEVVLIVVKPA